MAATKRRSAAFKASPRGGVEVNTFTPGLNTVLPPNLLGVGQAAVCENVDLQFGTPARRPGWTPYLGAAALVAGTPVSAVFAAKTGYTSARVLAIVGNSLYADNVLVTSTLVSSPAPTLPIFASFVAAESVVFFAMGDAGIDNWPLAKYNITSGAISTSTSPLCRCVAYHASALWVGGATITQSPPVPGRLYWSGLSGQTGLDTWPVDNWLDLDPGDADDITGFGTLTNALVVLKNESVWRVTGQPPDNAATGTGTISAAPLGASTGCSAPGTVASFNNLVIWLNQRGVFSYDGVHIRELTEPVRPFFETLDTTRVRQQASGDFLNANQYMLVVPLAAGGFGSLVITLSPFSIAQYVFASPGIVSVSGNLTNNAESANAVSAYLGMSDGHIADLNSTQTSDNGTAIPWTYTTGPLPMGPPQSRKVTRSAYIRLAAGTDPVQATLLPDYGTTGVSAVATPPAGSGEVTQRLLLPQAARSMQLQLSNSGATTGAAPVVSEFDVEFTAVHTT